MTIDKKMIVDSKLRNDKSLAYRLSQIHFRDLWNKRSCPIHRLARDIIIDVLFSFLSIEEIIIFRRLDKTFYILTHEPVIWKRILVRLSIPVAPLRPTYRFSDSTLDFEAEQLVARAVSLDDNWRKPSPVVSQSLSVYAYYQILDMKLLPGGKYLVACVTDAFRYYIAVYSVDHPNPEAYKPLAKVEIQSRGYALQAKYAMTDEVYGIVIVFLHCTWKDPETSLDPADYYICDDDLPAEMEYQLLSFFISLDYLDQLSHRHIIPGTDAHRNIVNSLPAYPFVDLMTISANGRFRDPSLFTIFRRPYATVTQTFENRHYVVVLDLVLRVITPMTFGAAEDFRYSGYRIMAHRVIPSQMQILVIRAIEDEQSLQYVIELYPLLMDGSLHEDLEAVDRVFINNKSSKNFDISEPLEEWGDDHPRLGCRRGPIPSLSIFMSTGPDERGIMQYSMLPVLKDVQTQFGLRRRWAYTLDYVTPQSAHIVVEDLFAFALPGVYRSLIYTFPETTRSDTPKLVTLRRYFHPDYPAEDYQAIVRDRFWEGSLRRPRLPRPKRLYSKFELPKDVEEKLSSQGFGTITYDEGLGRVCVVSAKERETLIILDFNQFIGENEEMEERCRRFEEIFQSLV